MQPNETRLSIAQNPYAWPGGYERFGITDDGGVLCYRCCRDEADCIDDAYPNDGWNIVAESHCAETDSRVQCDHCEHLVQDDWENE
jgi:hypothetical protein